MNRASFVLKRAFHSTPTRLRTAVKPRSSPRSIFSSSPSSSSSSSSSRSRPHYHQNNKPNRNNINSNAKGGPSSISLEQLKQKLVQHLKSQWNSASPSLKLSTLATDLGLDSRQLAGYAKEFSKQALISIERGETTTTKDGIEWDWESLRSTYITEGQDSLWSASLSTFLSFVHSSIPLPPPSPSSNTLSILHQLAQISDNRYAYETYPSARQQRRRLILHVGPTNSGKTYSALIALARARTGAYAGPLRLLAHEVFSRFNEGKIGNEPKRVCNLVTGEEQRILDPEAGLISCTVEMFPMTRRLDVGVVDEIQMIGDPQRGSAWTQAVVGSLCDELHLCGEESVVELVQGIAREMGDECIVKRYERLSPLVVADYSLEGDLKKIRKGDCLVTFSRSNIFMFKRQIESKTGLRVAVAYGGLPPEVREEQARAFNAGEYDVLVASDAVGMGLNLKIRRIVFESLHKWDGTAEVRLPTPQIKQIAGRAGRYGVHTPVSPSAPDLDLDPSAPPPPPSPSSKPDSVNGEATTLDAEDLPLLRAAMKEPTVQVTRASSTPPFETFKQIYQLLPPSTRMSRIFDLARSITRTKPHYRSTGTVSFGQVGDKIAHIHPLTFQERYTFGSAPVNLRDNQVVEALVSFVKDFAKGKPILMEEWGRQVGLFDALESINDARRLKATARENEQSGGGGSSEIDSMFTKQQLSPVFSPTTLQSLESSHRCLTLYLWLSYRLAPIFSDQTKARELRQTIEKGIEFVLEGIRFERVERGKGSKRNKAKFSGSGTGTSGGQRKG
ncbi:ATP-dependent RNA helicase SUV3 [Sporobolomyces salmoneus]|uniref:ATP-dependent RNA helicase SUV3 n=1 Tax=Sporobolomyces salmoneus TaxID=183962 RepID=UPI0031729477